jgi:hypothetical protein
MDVNDLKWAPASAFQAADEIIKLKKNKGPWEVIEKIVEMWEKTNPRDWQAFIFQLEDEKARGKVTNVGSKKFTNVSKDKGSGDEKGTGGTLRHQLDIPLKVVYMIRKVYPNLVMDKKFYNKWARKFPKMVVSEKV